MANPHPARPFAKNDPRINRNGRPKLGQSLADLWREYLRGDQVVERQEKRGGKTVVVRDKMARAQVFLESVFARAIRDSDAAARLIMNYHDGLPPFRAVITGEEPPGEADFSQLDDAELASLVDLMRKAHNGHNGAGKNGNGQGNGKAAVAGKNGKAKKKAAPKGS